MSAVQAPVELLEAMAELRLPARMDRRLQELMDHNTNGELTEAEREDLQTLVEWSESIAPVRAPSTSWVVNPHDLVGRDRSAHRGARRASVRIWYTSIAISR
jgi:hypothetical protein